MQRFEGTGSRFGRRVGVTAMNTAAHTLLLATGDDSQSRADHCPSVQTVTDLEPGSLAREHNHPLFFPKLFSCTELWGPASQH